MESDDRANEFPVSNQCGMHSLENNIATNSSYINSRDVRNLYSASVNLLYTNTEYRLIASKTKMRNSRGLGTHFFAVCMLFLVDWTGVTPTASAFSGFYRIPSRIIPSNRVQGTNPCTNDFCFAASRGLTLPKKQRHTYRRTWSSSILQRMSPVHGPSGDDGEEWNAVVAAFKMYKAAYGDLRVPQRFVVPNINPWPEQAWGLKLGKVVQAIRSTGKFIESSRDSASRRKILDQLGFVWSVRPSKITAGDQGIHVDQIVNALEVYKQIHGNANVPDLFEVPVASSDWPEQVWGLPLGRQLKEIRSSTNAATRVKFMSLGVEMEAAPKAAPKATSSPPSTPEEIRKALDAAAASSDDKKSANHMRFQKVYTALATYKNLFDDLLVPQPFVVPPNSQDWPEETWGLRLGARVNAIRSQGTFVNNNPARRTLLDDLGFVWSPPMERRRGRKPKIENEDEEKLSQMDSTTGASASSFDFGKDFKLPSDGEKASPTWNLDGAQLPDNVVKAAEQEAAMKEDEYLPPRTLAESLDEATARALECGVIDGLTERKRVIKGKREKNIPWFNDDFGDDFVFEDVVEALTIYKQIYGDFSNLTNSHFSVPEPKEISGFLDDESLDLFDVDASARAAAAIAGSRAQSQLGDDFIAAEIKRLQEDVDDEPSASTATEEVAPVEAHEIDSDQWPEHLAGMSLGNLVTRIRDGSLEVKHIPKRKKALDKIGFDWGDPKYFIDIPFEKAMCAMYAYYLVRGDMFVYEDFVMPDEEPWPSALAGYEIGKAVKRIRELQNFLEAYHPDKVSLLRMIDFIWFAETMALPLDPNETEMTPETLLLSAFGHPDYAKMIDIPMGLPDKIVADGPFYDTDDDPKIWWRKWHNWDYVKDYWYQQGRRDNGYVLRRNGYERMADEHEAKYGQGLFSQINDIMEQLDGGDWKNGSLDLKQEFLEKLNFFRQEMLGCSDIHPEDRDNLIADIDTQMLLIVKDTSLDMALKDELDTTDFDFQKANGARQLEKVSAARPEIVEEQVSLEADDEDFDVEDELGLNDNQ